MAKARTTNTSNSSRKMKPALTPEAEEQQMISLTMNLVKQRLIDGTASSQETTHFLKAASLKNKLELEKLRRENELLRAKAESIHSQQKTEELYREALQAMRSYAGQGSPEDD